MYYSPNTPNFFVGVFFLDDASDEGKEDGGDGCDFNVGHDRACDLEAGDEIGGIVDQDDVSAVEVANVSFVSEICSASMCALYTIFFCSDCSEFMIVTQLYQRGGPHMLKVRLDTFHALPRISRLVKKSHGAFKPSMAWLRNACYIVYLEAIKEASGFDVTCIVVRISDMERL